MLTTGKQTVHLRFFLLQGPFILMDKFITHMSNLRLPDRKYIYPCNSFWLQSEDLG